MLAWAWRRKVKLDSTATPTQPARAEREKDDEFGIQVARAATRRSAHRASPMSRVSISARLLPAQERRETHVSIMAPQRRAPLWAKNKRIIAPRKANQNATRVCGQQAAPPLKAASSQQPAARSPVSSEISSACPLILDLCSAAPFITRVVVGARKRRAQRAKREYISLSAQSCAKDD